MSHHLDTPLAGRGRECDRLSSFVADSAGGGGVLLVFGDPGIGKTALLSCATATASAAGSRVLRAAGVEFEVDVPFASLNQLLLPVLDEINALAPAQRAALSTALGLSDGPAPDRLLVSNAALSVLRHAAAQSPVLAVVDDLPWVDRASSSVLGFVARRLTGTRVGLLAAARSGEAVFFDHSGLPRLDVEPLTDDTAGELLAQLFPGLPLRARHRVLDEAQGNPLALLELSAGVTGSSAGAGGPLLGLPRLSSSLEALFTSRISQLPEPARCALLLAALDGTGDLRALELALSAGALEALEPAERARLVYVDLSTRRLAFRHPLTRSAVVALSTATERRNAHRRLGDTLIGEVERRAWHLGEATVEPDESVAGLLETAARRVGSRGDPMTAVAAWLRSADLSERPADRKRRLAEAAYLCANVTGEFDDTAKLLATLRDADPELRGSMHAAAAAALLLFNNGSLDAGHRLLVSTMRAQADGYDRDAEALYAALTALPTICLFGGRAELWEPFHEAIDVLGAQAPLDMRIVDHTWADPARTPPAILAELDGAIIAAADEPDPWKRLRAASLALFVDRAPATWSLTAQLIRGDLSDDALLGVHARSALSIDGFFKGAWDEVAVLIEQGEEICRRHRYDWSFFIFLHHRSLLTAGRGDRDELHRVLEVMHAWGAPRGSRHSHFAILHAQTLDALGHAEFERAYQLAAAISPPEAFASHVPIALWSAFDIVEAAVHTDRYPEAKARARALEDVAYISPRLALFAKAATALTSSDDVLPELVAQALEIPGADYFAFDYARVQLCFGERLRRLRATLRSRELLTAALETFEAMGARRWAGRAANELSATGQRKNADRYAAAALTPQELEIAELAAAGLTNRQIGERLFLSHRTVGAHLYRIFPKLEVTTRAALRDALATHTSS